METYYRILGVPETASNDQIKAAYLRMVKNYHPDKLPAGTPEMVRRDAAEKFLVVKKAYDVLSGSGRFVYDSQLAMQREDERQRVAFHEREQQSQPRYSPPAPTPKAAYCNICGGRLTEAGCAACSKRRSSVMWRFGAAWRQLDNYARQHVRWGLLWLFVVLAIIALAVGAINPSRPISPKPLQADSIAMGVLKHESEIQAIRGRFRASENNPQLKSGMQHLDGTLTGGFLGTVHNLSFSVKAKFGIFVEQNQELLKGCMTVQRPLFGSGPLLGTISNNLVRFDVTSAAFHIQFEGHRNGNRLSGTYQVITPGSSTQLGEFILEKNEDKELPLNFDPEKNCPADEDLNR